VPRTELASRNFYDVWLPEVAPSEALVKRGRQAGDDARAWAAFARSYRAEMKRPEARRMLDLLAALSHVAELSVGCYCPDESRCHRSLLRELLGRARAKLL